MAEDTGSKVEEGAQTRGEQLDETVKKVGSTLEDKAAPVADKVADKVIDKTGGLPE